MSSHLLSLQTAQEKSFKEQLKIGLSRVVTLLDRNRAKALMTLPKSEPDNLKDKMVMAFLKDRAIQNNDSDFLERLHADFWRGQGGEVFADNCEHRFDDLFLTRQAKDVALLKKCWDRGDYRHIVEIGCSGGLHLQHLTTTLSGVETAVGIDINPAQIAANQNNDSFDPRIQFLATDGGRWIVEHGQPNTLFVTNGGVLEYFRRERLDEIVSHIATRLGPALFFTVEPIAADYDAAKVTASMPFGEELSFSHNYRDLFESNGCQVSHQRPVDYQSWRMLTTIAVGSAKKTN